MFAIDRIRVDLKLANIFKMFITIATLLRFDVPKFGILQNINLKLATLTASKIKVYVRIMLKQEREWT